VRMDKKWTDISQWEWCRCANKFRTQYREDIPYLCWEAAFLLCAVATLLS